MLMSNIANDQNLCNELFQHNLNLLNFSSEREYLKHGLIAASKLSKIILEEKMNKEKEKLEQKRTGKKEENNM